MPKKDTYQPCLWSYSKEIINEMMLELNKRGIESRRESNLGIHILSVSKKKYNEVINIARTIRNTKEIGVMDYYRHRCGLNDHSLVYGIVSDAKKLESSWGIKATQPRFIKDMLSSLSSLCGLPIQLKVCPTDTAIEFYTTSDENLEDARDKIIGYLYENMGVMFENIYKCEDNGRLIKADKTRKRDTLYNLFDTSFISSGMHHPLGANLVPDTNEELLTESGYKSSQMKAGCQHKKQNIVLRTNDRYVINGQAELYEMKTYDHTWDAVNEKENKVLPVESSLVDNMTYNATIIVDDDVVKITTNYSVDRQASVSRELPFGLQYPSEVSIRNGLLPHPLKSGKYSGIIEEYYMKSTDGTKVLHYVTSSPLFEIYDIPSDFDFVKNNQALTKIPEVYDILEYNPEEPNIQSVRSIIETTAKRLMLSSKDN